MVAVAQRKGLRGRVPRDLSVFLTRFVRLIKDSPRHHMPHPRFGYVTARFLPARRPSPLYLSTSVALLRSPRIHTTRRGGPPPYLPRQVHLHEKMVTSRSWISLLVSRSTNKGGRAGGAPAATACRPTPSESGGRGEANLADRECSGPVAPARGASRPKEAATHRLAAFAAVERDRYIPAAV